MLWAPPGRLFWAVCACSGGLGELSEGAEKGEVTVSPCPRRALQLPDLEEEMGEEITCSRDFT